VLKTPNRSLPKGFRFLISLSEECDKADAGYAVVTSHPVQRLLRIGDPSHRLPTVGSVSGHYSGWRPRGMPAACCRSSRSQAKARPRARIICEIPTRSAIWL
jgi:hypothetical protein